MLDCYSFCNTDQPEYDPINFADIDPPAQLINWLIEATVSTFLAPFPLCLIPDWEDDF